MKVLHLNTGNETGGGMYHILSLLQTLNRDEFVLGVLEKGELYDKAREAGIQTIHFTNHTRFSIPLIRRIRRFIRRECVTVLHTHGPRANVYGSLLKKIAALQWMTTIHSDPQYDFRHRGMYGRLLTALHMHALKHADRLIAISEAFRTNLMQAGVEKEKMVTTLNGIDFRKRAANDCRKTDYGYAADDFIFLMVARLVPVKGHACALRAFAEITKKHPHCRLLFVGDGALKKDLQQLTIKLGIDQHVHFAGHHEETAPFYEIADVTLLTSFSESFPLVLLESARAKTPVIATNVGGIKKLVADRSLGWCTGPGDTRELALAMEETLQLNQQDKLQRMGDHLHQYAASRFSLAIFAENVYNVYLSMEG
jgi:glycosyltransferase involved in cell wall biosynthesis